MRCGAIAIWWPTERRTARVPSGCQGASDSAESVSDLTLGRKTVAWVFSWGDLDEGEDCLMIRRFAGGTVSSLNRARHDCALQWPAKPLPSFESVGNGGTRGAAGELLSTSGHISGGIVYSRSSYCNAACTPSGAPIPERAEETFVVSDLGQQTSLLGKGIQIVAADGGQLAAARQKNSLDIFDVKTRRWRRIVGHRVVEAKLGGGILAVLMAKGRLEVYDVDSGKRVTAQTLVQSVGMPLQLESLRNNLVVYVSNGRIRIRRTTDGREAVVALPSSAGPPLHAEIESTGLFYSYNRVGSRLPGRAGFIPMAAIQRALQRNS
jgi:hypothetical protein